MANVKTCERCQQPFEVRGPKKRCSPCSSAVAAERAVETMRRRRAKAANA